MQTNSNTFGNNNYSFTFSRLTTRIKGQQKPQQFILYWGLKTMRCNRKNHSDWPNSPEGPDPLHWAAKTSCGPWRSGWAWSILKVSSWPPAPHSRPGPRLKCSFLRWSPWTERGGQCERKFNTCLYSNGHFYFNRYSSNWKKKKKTVKHLARYGSHT